MSNRRIEQARNGRNTLAEYDIQFDFSERRRDFVFYDFYAHAVSYGIVFALGVDRFYAAHFEAHGRIEFKRIASGRRFGVAEHNADFHADLVYKYKQGFRLSDNCGKFAQRLAHKARLKSHVGISHIAFDFRLRSKGGNGVHNDNVDRTGTHQTFGYFQSLLAGIRLRNPQFVDVDAQTLCVHRIEGMFGVDKSRNAAHLLRFGDRVKRQRRFSRRFGTVHFNNTPFGIAAYAQRFVQQNRSARNNVDSGGICSRPQLHQRALPELFFDLKPGRFERLQFSLRIRRRGYFIHYFRHYIASHSIIGFNLQKMSLFLFFFGQRLIHRFTP